MYVCTVLDILFAEGVATPFLPGIRVPPSTDGAQTWASKIHLYTYIRIDNTDRVKPLFLYLQVGAKIIEEQADNFSRQKELQACVDSLLERQTRA